VLLLSSLIAEGLEQKCIYRCVSKTLSRAMTYVGKSISKSQTCVHLIPF
jgi:hypothetical protein